MSSSAEGIDFAKLGFDFTPTRSMVKYHWKDGSWGAATVSSDFMLNIHGLSNVLHYGQGIFEGLKAHHCADGQRALKGCQKD